MIQTLIDYVLALGSEPKLSELEATSGLDFGYEAGRTSASASGEGLTVDLYLEEAPRMVVGSWGRSEPIEGFDPKVTVIILRSSKPIEHPVAREGKEVLRDGYDREVWAWDRFYYYYPQSSGQQWMLDRRFARASFHSSAEDGEALRRALVDLVEAIQGEAFSFADHFAAAHADRAVGEGRYDFRSALAEVKQDRVDFELLEEITLDAFYQAAGMESVGFSLVHDRGVYPIPFQARGFTVVVERGHWPSGSEHNAADQGPTRGFLTRRLSLRLGEAPSGRA